jgi:hypothetical protein
MMLPIVSPARIDMYEKCDVGAILTYRATTFSAFVTWVVWSLFPLRVPNSVQFMPFELYRTLYAVTHCVASFRPLVVTLAISPTLPASSSRYFFRFPAIARSAHHPPAESRPKLYLTQLGSTSSADSVAFSLVDDPYRHAPGTVS